MREYLCYCGVKLIESNEELLYEELESHRDDSKIHQEYEDLVESKSYVGYIKSGKTTTTQINPSIDWHRK